MKRIFVALMLFACLGLLAARNEDLVAEWDFSRVKDADVAGKIPGGFLRGTAEINDGWLGNPQEYSDTPSGFQTSKAIIPELTPAGGFRIEAVCRLNKEVLSKAESMIFDNKYLISNPGDATHHGVAFGLHRRGANAISFYAYFGFGDHSQSAGSSAISLTPGEEHTLAMEYNGAGNVNFIVDGKIVGITFVDGMGLAPALRPAVIGDRFGSIQNWFDGQIRSLRLYSFPPQYISLQNTSRLAFKRGEENAVMKFVVKNLGDGVVDDVYYELSKKDGNEVIQKKTLGKLEAKSNLAFEIPVDTAISVGDYHYVLNAYGKNENGTMEINRDVVLRIGPADGPDEYPVLMWSGGSRVPIKRETIRDSGFTHDLGGFAGRVRSNKNLDALRQDIYNTLDDYVAMGFKRSSYFTLGHDATLVKQFPRYAKDGTPVVKNIEASNPEYQEIVTDTAAKTAQILAEHPGCDAVLINSEVRDSSTPSFGKYEPAAFEKFAGYPIPADIVAKSGPRYTSIPNFPISRVIKEDDKHFTYYKWFWKDGDGWNIVHSKVNEQYHKYIKRHFWSFFDPAVRTPPVWGSGGTVDYISHWTYAYPDPIRPAAVTDELIAMAAGNPNQKVMTMTQIICYRSATAPIGTKVENEPAWVKDSPKGPYISLAPDALKEAVWSMISRKVDGIMFHGDGSLWGAPGDEGYVMTNPDTKVMISHLLNDIVKPLGPTLKRIPERTPEVAILESFASSVFAGRGTWGWVTWLLDSHLMLQWANLSPAIIYEEKIARDGLDGIKVLCLFHCDVLTETSFNAIKEFQAKGGIIIADEYVVPGIVPDISVKSIIYPQQADKGKAALQATAAEIRKTLDEYYMPYSDADNMDIITRVRSYKNADYLFVLNDKREYGDYLGPWKKTMEKGLPNDGIVTLRRKVDTAAVYDLTTHKEVNFKKTADGIIIPQVFDSNDGRLLLAMEKKINGVKMTLKTTGRAKSRVSLDAVVLDSKGNPAEGLIPVNVTITTPDGKVLDGSGSACAVDGKFSYSFLLNEQTGKWNVTVTELASGKAASKELKIK